MTFDWFEVKTNEKIEARFFHSACVHDSKMYVYGGRKGKLVFDDLNVFDLEKKEWEEKVQVEGESPGKVAGFSMTCFGDRAIVVGGWDGSISELGTETGANSVNDLFVLQFVPKLEWKKIRVEGKVKGRDCHAAIGFNVNNEDYLFLDSGTDSDFVYLEDTAILSVTKLFSPSSLFSLSLKRLLCSKMNRSAVSKVVLLPDEFHQKMMMEIRYNRDSYSSKISQRNILAINKLKRLNKRKKESPVNKVCVVIRAKRNKNHPENSDHEDSTQEGQQKQKEENVEIEKKIGESVE